MVGDDLLENVKGLRISFPLLLTAYASVQGVRPAYWTHRIFDSSPVYSFFFQSLLQQKIAPGVSIHITGMDEPGT